MAAVAVNRLRVRRGGKVVLHDLTVEMAAGRVTGLLGPSASGKSTLLRAIMGVQRVEAGEVIVLGSPAGTPSLRTRVGYMTQSPSVYADLTASENLRFFARVLGAGERAVGDAIATVDLGADADRVVAEMSGGQRARVSLAAALLGEPELLVLDEPTVGLDPVLRRDLWNTFRDLAARGVSLLVSSHVMDEARSCDELVLLREGDVLATGSPDELTERTGTGDVGDAFLALVEAREEVGA